MTGLPSSLPSESCHQQPPKPVSEAVRRRLSATRTRDTAPELALRRELHSRGLRYRVNVGHLPGRPDILFPGPKLAVFVDGCFWHSCPTHGKAPKNNSQWWAAKLARTVQRDRENDRLLVGLGYEVLHVWEHEFPAVASDVIEAAVRRG